MYLPWNRGSGLLDYFNLHEMIIKGLTQEERKGLVDMEIGQRRKISERLGVSREQLEQVREQIWQQVNTQAWLKMRIRKGLRLPYTDREAVQLCRTSQFGPIREKNRFDFREYRRKSYGRTPQIL